jgi:hypothetical protein
MLLISLGRNGNYVADVLENMRIHSNDRVIHSNLVVFVEIRGDKPYSEEI